MNLLRTVMTLFRFPPPPRFPVCGIVGVVMTVGGVILAAGGCRDVLDDQATGQAGAVPTELVAHSESDQPSRSRLPRSEIEYMAAIGMTAERGFLTLWTVG